MPHQEEVAEQRPGEPPLKKMPDGDPSRDASGQGQLFASICVPGFTDLQEGMNGFAVVDLNKDAWLDIAIGCDNIGNAMGGFPHSRLYVFQPNGSKLAEGRFEDIGGTDLVPDFGDFDHDSTKDKAGPDINLRDLDHDGVLDLIQSCHVDVRDLLLPYSPVEYRQGVFCWKNLLVETGKLRFEKVTGNAIACEAHLQLDRATGTTTPVGKAPKTRYSDFEKRKVDLFYGDEGPARLYRREHMLADGMPVLTPLHEDTSPIDYWLLK